MMYSALVLLVTVLPLVTCHGLYTARVDRLGSSVILNCTENELASGSRISYWFEPSQFKVLYPGEEYNGMEVSADGSSLLIDSVNENRLGDYFCLVTKATEPVYTKTTLYLYEPTFMDLYKVNLIIGLSASGCFLVISTISCCVYVRKYEAHAENEDMYGDMYENGGYSTAIPELNGKKSYQVDTQF